MATIRKGGRGWQALIRRKGYSGPKSKTFASRAEAEIWARAMEEPLQHQNEQKQPAPLTVADAIEAFIRGPLKTHRSGSNEIYPLRATARGWLGAVLLSELTIRHLATWRDQRLTLVKANTVMRELRILRVLLDWVRDERGADLRSNPARELKAKAGNDARTVLMSQEEETQLLNALRRRKNPDNSFLMQLALTAAMRRSELLSLRWEDVDLENGVAQLKRKDCAAQGRTQDLRLVPLTKTTVELLASRKQKNGRIIHTTACSSRSAFERSKREAGLQDLRFHDLRHIAISRLWMQGYSALEISAASGHKDLKMLMRYSHYAPRQTQQRFMHERA